MLRERRYRTSLDRAGWALAAAALAGGLVAALLAIVGGDADPLAAAVAFAGGAGILLLITVALGLPLWTLLRRRADGPLAAALLGLAVGWLLLVAGQTEGFGVALPAMDRGTLLARWLSATVTAALLCPLPALIALVIWRIAYRRAVTSGIPRDD